VPVSFEVAAAAEALVRSSSVTPPTDRDVEVDDSQELIAVIELPPALPPPVPPAKKW